MPPANPDARKGTDTQAWLVLVVATIAVFAPFVTKPVHMDDPLFIWTAQHIVRHPLDFYGFDVNWYGFSGPIAGIAKNPPLYSYYLALIGSVFGWSEPALHLATMSCALAVVLGTARLGLLMGIDGHRAALCLLITPIFLVTGTTLMCDMAMLACWVWALCLWTGALASGSHVRFAAAALLACGAALSKYFGVCVLALMGLQFVSTPSAYRRQALVWLAAAALALLAYEVSSRQLYGAGLFGDAMRYAMGEIVRTPTGMLASAGTALSFIGAGLLGLFAMARLLSRVEWYAVAMVCGAALLVLALGAALGGFGAAYVPQQVVAVALGSMLLVAISSAVLRDRSASSLLLGAWVAGTLVFAAWLNWTVSARTLLPMLPPASLLLWRRLQDQVPATSRGAGLAMLATLLVALAVAFADYGVAARARQAAHDIAAANATPNPLWFQGHWGFQFYMQQLGGVPMDLHHSTIEAGSLIVLPPNNSNVVPLPRQYGEFESALYYGPGPISVINEWTGAGFYTDAFGKLPFVLGRQEPDRYLLFRVQKRMVNRAESTTAGTTRVVRH